MWRDEADPQKEAARRKAEIALLLPEIFRRALPETDRPPNVLSGLLGVMEKLLRQDEALLENLDCYFDPERLPEDKQGAFLPFLARWVDLDWLLPAGKPYEAGWGCLRDLILAAPGLAAMRGTRQGLKRFLEIATGLPGYQVIDCPVEEAPIDIRGESGRSVRPFTIIIECPEEAKPYRALIERIAAGEKPAYVTCNVHFVRRPAQAVQPKGEQAAPR